MNRAEQRRMNKEIARIPREVLDHIRTEMVVSALATVKEALHREYGFADKRYKKLEARMHEIIKEGEVK